MNSGPTEIRDHVREDSEEDVVTINAHISSESSGEETDYNKQPACSSRLLI